MTEKKNKKSGDQNPLKKTDSKKVATTQKLYEKIMIGSLMLISIMTFTSCSQRLIDFTVISSKNISFPIDKSQGKRVEGSSMMVFGIGVNIKDAMDKALQSAVNEYYMLVDGVVRVVVYPFFSGYKVEGTAVSTSKMKASLGQKGFEIWCKANNVFDATKAVVQN